MSEIDNLKSEFEISAEKIKQSDIKVIYGPTPDNNQIVPLLKSLGVSVTKSDLPEFYWKATV